MDKNTDYLVVFGTRPEAIKLAPIINELNSRNYNFAVCNTGQHKELVDTVIQLFKINVNFNLEVMERNQTLAGLTSKIISKLEEVFQKLNPKYVFVQGDTTTAMVASLISYYHHSKIYHIEAGLRTYNLYSPFPEEGNRKLISELTTIHFAPTQKSRQHLISEGVNPDDVKVVGNTIVDSLELVKNSPGFYESAELYLQVTFGSESYKNRLVLITTHRRENIDGGMLNLCNAIKDVADKFENVNFLLPIHPNPNVTEIIRSNLCDNIRIQIVSPINYKLFLGLLIKSYMVVTDSGGIQEEAATLGIPLLVIRETTERTEAIDSGNAMLVGNQYEGIFNNIKNLLIDKNLHNSMSRNSDCFGIPGVSNRIVEIIKIENEKNSNTL